MTLALDCSVTLAWLFEDEKSFTTDEILARVEREGAHVPTIWCLEVANTLQGAVRRGRIDITWRDTCLKMLGRLDIQTDARTGVFAWASTLALANDHRLTLYDAAYLELALRQGLPLATLDRKLRSVAETIGMRLMPLTTH